MILCAFEFNMKLNKLSPFYGEFEIKQAVTIVWSTFILPIAEATR